MNENVAMNSILTETIGYLAAFFGTVLMLPQVYKSFKTKQVKDISLFMVIIYIINCALWEFYGWLIDSNPIILCNLVAILIGWIQLYMKIKYTRE